MMQNYIEKIHSGMDMVAAAAWNCYWRNSSESIRSRQPLDLIFQRKRRKKLSPTPIFQPMRWIGLISNDEHCIGITFNFYISGSDLIEVPALEIKTTTEIAGTISVSAVSRWIIARNQEGLRGGVTVQKDVPGPHLRWSCIFINEWSMLYSSIGF